LTTTAIERFSVATGCLLSGCLTGGIAIFLLEDYAVTIREANFHEGMTFTWKVYSLVGIGLLCGLLSSILVQFLQRFPVPSVKSETAPKESSDT